MDGQRSGQLAYLASRMLGYFRERPELGTSQAGPPLYVLVVLPNGLNEDSELLQDFQHLAALCG